MRRNAITAETILNEHEALAYMVECTLATVDGLMMRSRPPRGEVLRQIAIAEGGLRWIGPGYRGGCGRLDRVREMGGVQAWAARHRPEFFARPPA